VKRSSRGAFLKPCLAKARLVSRGGEDGSGGVSRATMTAVHEGQRFV